MKGRYKGIIGTFGREKMLKENKVKEIITLSVGLNPEGRYSFFWVLNNRRWSLYAGKTTWCVTSRIVCDACYLVYL